MDVLVIIILFIQLALPIALVVFIVRVLVIQKRLKDEIENLNIQLKEIIDKKNEGK